MSIVVLSGCSKECKYCSDCPRGIEVDQEICEDEFYTKPDYEEQIQLMEGYGCNCQ